MLKYIVYNTAKFDALQSLGTLYDDCKNFQYYFVHNTEATLKTEREKKEFLEKKAGLLEIDNVTNSVDLLKVYLSDLNKAIDDYKAISNDEKLLYRTEPTESFKKGNLAIISQIREIKDDGKNLWLIQYIYPKLIECLQDFENDIFEHTKNITVNDIINATTGGCVESFSSISELEKKITETEEKYKKEKDALPVVDMKDITDIFDSPTDSSISTAEIETLLNSGL